MILYHFDSKADLALYLRKRGHELRTDQQKMHPRSHRHAQLGAAAAEVESLLAIVNTSNITVHHE